MAERDRYIPGVPCWADTTQPDPQAAAQFYGGLFGWELADSMPEAADGHYFTARIRGGDVAAISSAQAEDAGSPAVWNTYVWVASAEEATAAARAAGGQILLEPFDVMDAGRMAVIADPEGAVFSVWQPKDHRGATVVNEHGSVNFNGLATRDQEAAAAFYGAVFGWRLLPIPGGLMWALPGYGDHLEVLFPGTYARQEEFQAPDGFIDVVATVEPIPDDDTTTTAHWNVTFAVDDVDATAAKARELGGEVVDGPDDAPWSRTAVIRDPQGARFIASQFIPENRDLEA